MRVIRFLIALACLLAGIVVGALNPQPVLLDLGPVAIPSTLGVAVLVAVLAGVVLGGLAVTAGVVLPLRQRLRKSDAASRTPDALHDGR